METIQKPVFTRVWAPTLVSFTSWVLKEALAWNIHKLYFLARDAHMCYEIAKVIVAEKKLPISCRYLEGSRYAWRMAEFALPDADPIEKICVGGIHVTLRKILKRGGLTDGEVEQIARELGKRDELDVQLSYEEIQRMKPFLSSCGELRRLIKGHARSAYELTTRYFAQEGLLEQNSFALVDSGWVGSLQETVERLRQAACSEVCRYPIQGFYFGLYELPKGVDSRNYHTYYFRPYQDVEKKARFSNCLFEAVCSAKEGMTTGYREQGGKVIPVYESVQNPNKQQIAENEALLEVLLKEPDALEKLNLPVGEVRERLEQLMSTPMKQEAEDYGSYLFSDDVSDSSLRTVAGELDDECLRDFHAVRRFLIMKGLIKRDLQDCAWPEGSIVLTGSNIKYHLFHLRMYKRLIYFRKKFRGR